MRYTLLLLTAAARLVLAAPADAPKAQAIDFTPPAVRNPSGLVSDAGNGKTFLEWNPGLEENLAGYRVYRQDEAKGAYRRVTAKLLGKPEFVDTGLKNGQSVRYRVTAELKSGLESGKSNITEVTPRETKAPVVTTGEATIRVPGFDPIQVSNAVSVTFENGHRIVLDRSMAKVRDWIGDDGTHLLYPLPYGNPIDLTEMDDMGFPVGRPATADRPAIPPQINLDYARPQPPRRGAGPGGARGGRSVVWWVGYEVTDNRITFQYRIPLTLPGVPGGSDNDLARSAASRELPFATVWETWIPVERAIAGGAIYKGLARKIELEMPSYYTEGYSVCVNDGFGPNGSADQGRTFELHWSGADSTFLQQTTWEKGKPAKGLGTIRATSKFHPSDVAVQAMPFLMAQFPQGTLLLAPRRYFYSTSYAMTNYADQGKDGIWPNYTIDSDANDTRTSIETFEYLWTADNKLAYPQKFADASFHYRRNLADLYSLIRNVTTWDYAWDNWGPSEAELRGKAPGEQLQVLRQWGTNFAARSKEAGADIVGGAHELWTSSPYTVSADIRLNPNHPINRAISDMVGAFHQQGLRWGYWIRPEFIKQTLPSVLSNHIYTGYYGYVRQLFPPGQPIVEDHGLKLVREHPEWIRLGKNGAHPIRTPYNWTPASLTRKGWYEEVMYKDLVMMRKLGYDSVFQDGGGTSLPGVDYTAGRARSVMPYYWRLYQDMARLGMDLSGELPSGWGNNTVPQPTRQDMKQLWALAHSVYRGNLEASFPWYTAEMRHKSHQLYAGAYLNLKSAPEHAVVARFAQKFLKENGHPDRVFMENLRWDAAGSEWVWDNVYWEYKDGRRVRYPNYAEVVKP